MSEFELPAPTVLVTIDSLRHDHYQYMDHTKEALGESHPATFATYTGTAGSFQSIFTGQYPSTTGINGPDSFVPSLDHSTGGISTNRLLTERYGYDAGFDTFTEPSRETTSVKEMAARRVTPTHPLFGLASRVWNIVQSMKSYFGVVDRQNRLAEDVIDEFLSEIPDDGDDVWFGWLHLMDPHHAYAPEDGPVSQAEAQAVSRRLLSGNGSSEDAELARELYRQEIEEMDESLQTLWSALPEDARIICVSDHGELLGEQNGKWGHLNILCPETIHVPLATRNTPDVGEVVSLVDIPSLVLGEEYGRGMFDRETAFAVVENKYAAFLSDRMATADGVTMFDGATVDDPELERILYRFQNGAYDDRVEEDIPADDLQALGYL